MKKKDHPFQVENIEGKGEGLVATRDLVLGDFIASEDPQLKSTKGEPSVERLECMLSQLSTKDRQAFDRLHNCHTHEAFGGSAYTPSIIIGKWKTNAFGIGDEDQAVCLGPITKINHSCKENVARYFCPETNTMTVVACDYIKKGQELVQSYIYHFRDCASRRLNLFRKWGFWCTCDVCSKTPDALTVSDERRLRLDRIYGVELEKRLCSDRRMELVS